MSKSSDGKGNIILSIKSYLKKKYEFRHNLINNKIEYKRAPSHKWSELNEDNVFIDLLEHNKPIAMTTLLSLLNSDFVPSYDPFKLYFSQLSVWDRVDHIQNLANYISTSERERFDLHFRKMFVRTIACALSPTVFNKNAFILVQEAQNDGKSTFCRYLVPKALEDYIAENISTDKDGRISVCENFIINLDELAKINKRDINELKSLFSTQSEKIRRPYGKRAERIIRKASFIGSTNTREFLTDETGSVRWLCFTIDKINWDYKKDISIDNVWGQAYHLYNTGFEYNLTRDEVDENHKINARHNVSTSEFELIQLFLKPGTEKKHDEFWASTQIMEYLTTKTERRITLSSILIGKALKMLEFERAQKWNGQYQIKGYYLSYLLRNNHE